MKVEKESPLLVLHGIHSQYLGSSSNPPREKSILLSFPIIWIWCYQQWRILHNKVKGSLTCSCLTFQRKSKERAPCSSPTHMNSLEWTMRNDHRQKQKPRLSMHGWVIIKGCKMGLLIWVHGVEFNIRTCNPYHKFSKELSSLGFQHHMREISPFQSSKVLFA